MTAWAPPSPRCAELLTEGVRRLLERAEVFEAVDAAVMAAAGPLVERDPTLAEALRATDRMNIVHWATATLRDPGARVTPNVGPETLGIARDMVRRGIDRAGVDVYRAGQNAVWQQWMATVFELTADPDELRELLEVSARSIFTFVEETLAGINAQVDREREQLTSGTHAERLATVNLLLEGAPIPEHRASVRLGYDLGRRHLAAILWAPPGTADEGELDSLAERLARTAGAPRALTVVPSATSLWMWCVAAEEPERAAVAAALHDAPHVRLAVGSTGDGVEGFRRGHLDAQATQRLMHRARPEPRLARFADVGAVALAAADEERALEFTARTLGELAGADETLRETLRVYLREACNATRAARVLYAHRNTVLGRLQRAEALLPAPLTGRTVEVGLALDLARWLGVPAAAGAT
jgi:DNA-binding PucR family transcriptional regulator